MPLEPNHNLTFAQEVVMTIRQDGRLVAIEIQNGHIERYMAEEATKANSLALFGADKPQGVALHTGTQDRPPSNATKIIRTR
jgi:hypothetical protein